MSLIDFKPIYQERVWGGRGLAERLGRPLPDSGPIGEAWEIVDRPEACSVVASGKYAGKSLRQIIAEAPEAIMGPGWPADKPFPILVKWLDCQERLSLQVHPPAEVADELKGEPKTENWFIVEATPEAAVLAGLAPGVTRESFETALKEQRLEPLVCRIPCKPGDSLFVPSGRLHAIDAGNLILEIQQNSDTTYRVYDWGRVGLDGQPRQLHISESLHSIHFNDVEPELKQAGPGTTELVNAKEFRLRSIRLGAGESITFAANEAPRILSVTSGTLSDDNGLSVPRGSNVLLPWSAAFTFTAQEADTLILVTDQFAACS